MSAAALTKTASLQVTPLSAHIGAEIQGVDLSRPLEAHQVAQIRAALLKWRVIFFREQFLTHEQHVAFSAQFGELTLGHPVFGHVEGHPEIYSISKFRKATRFEGQALLRPWTGWHTDVTAAVNPPFASILRGVTIPPYGGDTQWTRLVAAYEKLPARRRRAGHGRLRAGRRGGRARCRASARARAPGDRRACVVCQPRLPQDHRRC